MSVDSRYTVFTIKKKEKKTITFHFKDTDGNSIVIPSGSTFELKVVNESTEAELFTKADGDFDKSLIAEGKVSVLLTDSDLDTTGHYLVELKATFSDTGEIDKSQTIKLVIEDAITD